MGAIAIIGCIMWLWERLALRYKSRFFKAARAYAPRKGAITVAIAALPLLLLAQIVLLHLQTKYDTPPTGTWATSLPIAIFDGDHGSSAHHGLFSVLGFAIGASESALLGLIILAVSRGTRLSKPALILAVALSAIISCVAPELSTSDPYEYVATGILGFGAYAPPNGALAGTIYGPISKFIPLGGVIYGPLWVIVDVVQTWFGSSVVEKIYALRLWNVGLILGLVQIMRASRLTPAVIFSVILNPALWFYSVVNPHADIQGLVLLATAFYFARNVKIVPAILALTAAGLIKLPFVIIGGAILMPIKSPPKRVAMWVVAIGAVAAISFVIPGHAYAVDLVKFAALKTQSHVMSKWIFFVPIVALAMLALVLSGKRAGGISLFFSQAGPIAAPWYLYWGAAYAIASGFGEVYMVSLPLLATLSDDMFELFFLVKVLIVMLVAAVFLDQIPLRFRGTPAAAMQK